MTPTPPAPVTWHVALFGGFNVTTAEAIAFGALIVSAFALLRPWIKERRKEAKASIGVRIEQSQHGHQYIVTNHGPAAADNVEVDFKDAEVDRDGLGGYNRHRKTPRLHPGEEHLMDWMTAMGEEIPRHIEVHWNDGRLRRQSRDFYPSVKEP